MSTNGTANVMLASGTQSAASSRQGQGGQVPMTAAQEGPSQDMYGGGAAGNGPPVSFSGQKQDKGTPWGWISAAGVGLAGIIAAWATHGRYWGEIKFKPPSNLTLHPSDALASLEEVLKKGTPDERRAALADYKTKNKDFDLNHHGLWDEKQNRAVTFAHHYAAQGDANKLEKLRELGGDLMGADKAYTKDEAVKTPLEVMAKDPAVYDALEAARQNGHIQGISENWAALVAKKGEAGYETSLKALRDLPENPDERAIDLAAAEIHRTLKADDPLKKNIDAYLQHTKDIADVRQIHHPARLQETLIAGNPELIAARRADLDKRVTEHQEGASDFVKAQLKLHDDYSELFARKEQGLFERGKNAIFSWFGGKGNDAKLEEWNGHIQSFEDNFATDFPKSMGSLKEIGNASTLSAEQKAKMGQDIDKLVADHAKLNDAEKTANNAWHQDYSDLSRERDLHHQWHTG